MVAILQPAQRVPGTGHVVQPNSGGSCVTHSSMAQAQRGWNGQPVGTWRRSGGDPEIPVITFLSPRSDGNDLVSP